MDLSAFVILVGLALIGAVAFGFFVGGKKFSRWFAPDVVATAQSALIGVEEKSQLVVFAARVVVTATGNTEQGALFPSKMTLIVPGRVLYGIDLSRISDDDFRYDRANSRLQITVPDVEIISVEPDLTSKEEFPEIGIRKFFGAEPELRKQAEAKIAEQMRREAESPDLAKLARHSAAQQIESLFAPALRAAGHNKVDIDVIVGTKQNSA
jgi:Protein of unknown function (DUF4230)